MIGSLSYTEWFVPSVASVGNKKYLALGAETKNEFVGTSTTEITKMWLKYAVWTAGQFSSAEIKEAEWMILASTNIYSYYNEKFTRSLMMSIIGFNHKNDSDLLFNAGYVTLASQRNQYQQIRIEYKLASLPQQIFGDPDAAYVTYNKDYGSGGESEMLADKYYKRFYANSPSRNILPVAANNEYLFRAEISGNKLIVDFGQYNPRSVIDTKTVDVTLPSRAKIFTDSAAYAVNQRLWFIFVGTGLVFAESLSSDTWGYLDTTTYLGVISYFGSISYDSGNNALYISGVDSLGNSKLIRLNLPASFDYASNGTWLPTIYGDFVPAYIKAKEIGGA